MAEKIILGRCNKKCKIIKNMKKIKSKKPIESKECVGADASGSYEAPMSKTILKRDIHKLHNFKPKQQEVDEVTDSSSSGQYDAPMGHGAKTQADALKLDNVETNGSASITAAPTKNMTAMKKGFPRYGGPGGKYVEIDKKCKTFPYCNQGADNQIKLHEGQILQIYESKEVKNTIAEVAKEYGIPIKEVQKMVLDSLLTEGLPKSFFDDPGNLKAFRGWTEQPSKTKFRITTKEPLNFIMDDDVDLAKLKLMFYKHDVKFDTEEIKD